MKRAAALLMIFFLTAISLGANTINPPKGFEGQLWKSTLALYGSLNGKTHYVCTAEVIGKSDDGYTLLSAGHCVQEIPDGVQFSVSETISGTRMPVHATKVFDGPGLDFAVFDFPTKNVYPIIQIDDQTPVNVGDKVVNPNFARGFAEQLSIGTISSQELPISEECTVDDCVGYFMVQLYGSAGSSGSAVISAKTHKIIGIIVYGFNDTIGFGVEPISRFRDFMKGPNQPHPAPLPIGVIE